MPKHNLIPRPCEDNTDEGQLDDLARALARQIAERDFEGEEAARRAWYAYYDTHELPPDIPRDPDVVYRDSGWAGWRDWIGSFNA